MNILLVGENRNFSKFRIVSPKVSSLLPFGACICYIEWEFRLCMCGAIDFWWINWGLILSGKIRKMNEREKIFKEN